MKGMRIALILLLLTLTGCMEMKVHVTVNLDGSADLEYKLGFESSFLSLMELQGQNPLKDSETELKAEGYRVESYRDGNMRGIVARRRVEKFTPEDIASFGEAQLAGEGLTVDKGFFRTTYRFETQLDIPDLVNEIAQGFLDNVTLEFGMTLPIKPSKHNASRTDNNGKSLYWDLSSGEVESLYVEAGHWNFLNLALVGGGVLAAMIILLLVLRRKKENYHKPI
jgi:hypothetical protein